MTREEYAQHLSRTPDWAPGYDAIVERLEGLYGRGRVAYIDAARYPEKNSPLEGFCAVRAPGGYWHIVTVGLSNIHANLDVLGCALSGWGFELTIKWPDEQLEPCGRAFHLLGRLAAYAQARRIVYTAYHSISFRLIVPAPRDISGPFAGALFVPDTELDAMETLHGRVRFLQVVNVTANELKCLKKLPGLARQLAFGMAQDDNPSLCIRMEHRHDYLE